MLKNAFLVISCKKIVFQEITRCCSENLLREIMGNLRIFNIVSFLSFTIRFGSFCWYVRYIPENKFSVILLKILCLRLYSAVGIMKN